MFQTKKSKTLIIPLQTFSLVEVASDYLKRPNVLRLKMTPNDSILLQAIDFHDMNSWIDAITYEISKVIQHE